MPADASTILQRQGRMETARSNFEQLWNDVAQLMLPRQADFLGTTGFGGARFDQGRARSERIFDEQAMQSLDHGVAVFEGEVIPQGGQWQRLEAREKELMKNLRVRLWFEQLGDKLFALRNSAESGFANQSHESIASLLSFGVQGMWPDLLKDPAGQPYGISYRSEHIGQIYIQEDYRGVVDTLHRKFTLTHRQAIQKWDARAPEVAQKGMRDRQLDQTAEYLHVLEPNRDYRAGRLDAAGKPVASCYVSIADRQLFDEGGYRVMPLVYSRYEKSPTEDYGRSPAITVLPAVRATQAMMRDLVTAIEFAARPALLAHEDMLDQMMFYAPGGVSYGAIDERGNPKIRAMFENADIQAGLTLLEQTREVIKRAFFEDLYAVRQEVKTHVSATEMMIRDQQRGVLLSPLKRQETEWFTPMTVRELDLMNEMGMLDDMPPELMEAGGLFQIVYENPLGRARSAGEAAGFYQMLDGLAPLMQVNPQQVAAALFQKFPIPNIIDGLARVHGVPASWEASEDDRAAAQEQDDTAIQDATALDAGERASLIAKNLGGLDGGGAIANAA